MKTKVFNTLLELEKKYNLLSCDMIHNQVDLYDIQETLTDLLAESAGTDQRKIKKLGKELPYLFKITKQ